jgi:RNA polymerase sigma factor (sigma-70 family)
MPTPALQSSTSLFRGESALSEGHAATGDRALLERLAASELDALDLVLAKFWSPLVRYLISILASREAAEDAAQEAFYRLWQHRRELDVEGSLRGFLYQVARNLAISERRRHLAFERAAATMRIEQDVAVSIEMKDDDLDATLRRALRTLSKRRREILLLHAVHDLSYKEIAAMLDIAPQTVANQFSAAIASLRRLLSPSSMV